MPRLKELNEYWEDNPPLHILAKAFVGYKGKENKEEVIKKQNIDDFVTNANIPFNPNGSIGSKFFRK